MLDNSRPNRIEFDIAHTGEEIVRIKNEAGLESPLPKRASPFVAFINVRHETLIEAFHQMSQRIPFMRGGGNVHMVMHEHVGVNLAPEFCCKIFKPVQVVFEILFLKEAGTSVVPTLNQVDWNAGNHNAGAAWHFASMARHDYLSLRQRKNRRSN